MGMNGHLGFNEPAASLTPRTHRVRLLPATRRANAYLFDGRLREVPRRVFHGNRDDSQARDGRCCSRRARQGGHRPPRDRGPRDTRVPASLIQTHPNALVVLDRAAASELMRRHGAQRGGGLGELDFADREKASQRRLQIFANASRMESCDLQLSQRLRQADAGFLHDDRGLDVPLGAQQ